MLNKIMY